VPFRNPLLTRMTLSKHTPRASAECGASCVSLCLSKHVYYTEPPLDLNDGLES